MDEDMRTLGIVINNCTQEVFYDVSITGCIDEMDKIIDYLKYVRKEYESKRAYRKEHGTEGGFVPLSYSSWNPEWTEEESDFTVILHEKGAGGVKVITMSSQAEVTV